jgi:ParB-like chromosome segregation protein Spo0J
MARTLNPEILERIRPLVGQGLNGRQIAKAVGISEREAQWYAQQVRAGRTSPYGSGPDPTPPAARLQDVPLDEIREAPGSRTGVWTPDQPALTPHPLAELFPPLEGPELAALTADIAAYGLREAIVLYEGQILDGRHRFRACQALGIACPIRAYTGDDPLAYVVSLNLQRRHLRESQRAMVAVKLANMRQGARTDVQPPANLPEVSTAQAADALHISERLVRHAKKVRAEAQPEVIRAVEAGHLAVSAAAKLAEKPVGVQRAVVEELASGAAKTVTAALKHVTQDRSGRAGHLSRAQAEFDRRLAQTDRYFAKVAQSTLIEGLGRQFAEESIGGWRQALEHLSSVTQQLAGRLVKAFQEQL